MFFGLKFRKEKKEFQEKQQKKDYLNLLSEYVGKPIEVHYLRDNSPNIEKGILMFPPGKEFFYLGEEKGYHIIYWNREEGEKRSGVKLILNEKGEEIYKNEKLPFDLKERK